MDKSIKITCLNTKLTKLIEPGRNLAEIAEDFNLKLNYPILGARVNNRIKELSHCVYKPKMVKFFDITDIDGYRMYIRSLCFVLMKATRDVLPGRKLRIEHSISKGFYCEVDIPGGKLEVQSVLDIADRMREIVLADIPFIHEEIPTVDAIEIFEKNNMREKAKLFRSRPSLYTSIYHLDDQINYFFGYLVPSTGLLKMFDLVPYYDGMLLRFPNPGKPEDLGEIILQDKMFDIFQEYKAWGEILEVSTIGQINERVQRGESGDLIKVSEALHEKKVSQIADSIKHKETTKLVLISGPSSSGKTTFCKRLAVQLTVLGLKPIQISLDNYFVDREKTPKDEHGEYDFESIDALDVDLFNQNFLDLLDGKEVEIPSFSFETGMRYYTGEKLKISHENIILVEGIHGLNPKLSSHIKDENKYKIYVSALTQVGIDYHNRIPTTDNRLLRRIIRDYQYRGYSALQTLRRWPSVRRGEEKNIFPYQEEADVMFNSALLYELSVLKQPIEPLLKDITETEPEYAEARRLLKFLSYFVPVKPDEIPPTSILREFLHGSSFKY